MRDRTTTTPWTRLAAPLVLAVALVTGCGQDGDDTAAPTPPPSPPSSPSPEPSPTGEPTPSPTETDDGEDGDWETCTSTRAGVVVSHPAGWTARDYPDGGGCAYFDPEPFEVQPGTEATGMTVRLDVERVEYERIRDAYTSEDGLISEREVEVAGYPAVRVEDRDTAGPYGGAGHRVTYLADLGDERTLLLTTSERDASDPELGRRVLDQMADRVERDE